MAEIAEYIRGKNNRSLTIRPEISGSVISQPGESHQADPGSIEAPGHGAGAADLPGVQPVNPTENLDPLRRRISKPVRGIKKLIYALLDRSPWRELTPEESAVLDEKKRRQAMQELLKSEAILFRERIVNALNRLGLCYRYSINKNDLFGRGLQAVKFDYCVLQPDAIYLRVNTSKLPRGIGILQLTREEVLTDLSVACGHRVSANWDERVGCWYIIERASGVLGIPGHVKFSDLMRQIPASADGLSIPLGMGANNRPIYRSLGQMYSMLIGGTIGSGKSNILNVILCSLISRNHPDRLKLLLVDLKGGLEFNFYEGIPHLLPIPEVAENGIAYERSQVPDVLKWLFREGERRIGVMRQAGEKDIGRFNAHHRKSYMPHIVLVIDEWADVKMEPKTGKESEDYLTNIAQRFRAVGIHVILCTQVPKSEVISTRIKGVLPAKLAFSCPTIQGSMAIIDNGHAKSLEPAGRCVLQWQDEIIIQTPYINELTINDVVKCAVTGQKCADGSTNHDVTELEVMSWALEHDNGWLSLRRLFAEYKQRGLKHEELENWLKEWEGKEYVIGSSLYRVDPPAGNKARRLVAVEESNDDQKSDL